MKRAGQGLSVNIIILIALGLLILVIAVLLVNRSGRNLSDNTTTSCISKGGVCRAGCDVVSGREVEVQEGNRNCEESSRTQNTGKPVCCRYNFAGEDPNQR
jgi:hypothetical protein